MTMQRMYVAALLSSLAWLSHATDRAALEDMAADIITYESCVEDRAAHYAPTGESPEHIAITAGDDCAVYHRNYLAKASNYILANLPAHETDAQRELNERSAKLLLMQHHDNVRISKSVAKDKAIAAIIRLRSAQR